MAITAAQVKELRERTGIGMMECKKALIASDGDMDKAIDELRKKGLAKAAKKADRETSEWYIKSEIDGDNVYLVWVQCETDFLARSDGFQTMLSNLIAMLKDWKSESEMDDFVKEQVLELWENMKIKDAKIITWEVVASYVHSNWKIAAVLTAKSWTDIEKLKQVAMHVTATNPEYLSPNDISDEVVEKEKQIQLEMMKNDPKMWNKSDDILLKIIEGKMGKFKSEISLLEQAFVIDPNQKVKDVIWNDSITAFYRFSI